jgi:hypothetical protein
MLEVIWGAISSYILLVRMSFSTALWKSLWRFLKKLKIELPYDSAIPLLGIYLKGFKSSKKKDVYMFFSNTIYGGQIMNEPRCPSTAEWTKKLGVCTK